MACGSCGKARQAGAQAIGQGARAIGNLATLRTTQARANIAEAVRQAGSMAGHIGTKLSGGKQLNPKRIIK